MADSKFVGWKDQLDFASSLKGSKGNRQRESASSSGQSASKKEADKKEKKNYVDRYLARCPDHRQCGACGVYDDDEDILGGKPYPWGYVVDKASSI